ncbi:restriction endonuclease subunit S [Lyngbya sp. CCAP 1446/10]|uniref:restriction endonuclease subunit S n=1 Tax=Lyngbya sp. CCAP 1446/10 TaxID=439293 RepID=UPI0022376779|nr:restriction endonuclease subunit S [Lyngbya sp. CCAP 1446/10]MCW6052366.1 restriction endonuclease subunit S [Lyngbya sp. CCAP 1446/10]
MSKKVNRKVPKLRFSEFEGDWKFGEVSDLISSLDAGVSVNSEDRAANQVEKGILKTSCISNGVFNPTENKVVADEHELSRLKAPVTKNTILISRMNTPILVGANSYIEKDYPNLFLPDRLWAAKIKKINFPKWVSYYFIRNKVRGLLSSRATGTSNSMKNITKNDVLTLPVYFPSIAEQEKIASFLGAVDTRLSQLRRKHELLQTYKRGVMQKLFSQQIRFKRNDGQPFPDWENKKIKEVATINQGLQIAISDRFTHQVKGSYFYITNEVLKPNNQTRYYIFNPSKRVICGKDDILMTRTGNTGQVVTDVDGAFHNNFFKIDYNKKEINKKFLIEFLRKDTTQHKILSLAGTSTIPDLNHSDFYNLDIGVPYIEEQEKIADFLTAIDKKIEAIAQQIELTEQFKKGLLQKMFV